MMNRGPWMFQGGGIMGIIVIAVIAYFLIKYFDENKSKTNNFRKQDNAMDIIDERYAKGEIDDEEYNRRKQILQD